MHATPGAVILKLACLAILFPLLVLGGCTLPEQGRRQTPQYMAEPLPAGYARLNAFFALKDSRTPVVRMEIAEVSILSDDVWLPVTDQPLSIDTGRIADGQISLGSIMLPEGSYSRLRFVLPKVELRDAAGDWRELALASSTVEIPLAEMIPLAAGDSEALFVTWDVENSLAEESGFVPVLQASGSVRQLLVDLLFVSCPEIDTIFVIRADTNRVVDAFALKGGPTWMAAAREARDGFLYVLAARERMVKVVDLSTYRTVDFFPAPLNDVPTFMLLDGGRSAFLLDEKSGYLSRLNLRSGVFEARVQIGFQPNFAVYLERKGLLAVSLGLSQKVVLLDPASLANRGNLTTAGRPQGLLLFGEDLYVAEQGNDTVAVFDPDTRRDLGRIKVSRGPTYLTDTGNQVYVSHRSDPTLSVLMPGQFTVLREIHDLGQPRQMAYNATYRRLYVADERIGGLGVVDVNANFLVGRVYLGARPFGLVAQ